VQWQMLFTTVRSQGHWEQIATVHSGDFSPAMPYDSYVTFQAVDTPTDTCPQCSPTGTIFTISNPSNMIPATFNTSPFGHDLTLVDGSWFIRCERAQPSHFSICVMKKFLLSSIPFFFVLVCNAQLVKVIHEEIRTGGIGGIPDGYSTYRIYALLKDATDRVSAVFGSNKPSPMHHLKISSSLKEDAIWNSQYGGVLGSTNNCAFWGFFPEAEFDSHVTIGLLTAPQDSCKDCNGEAGTIFQISNPSNVISETFAPVQKTFGPDLTLMDGSWFIPNDGSCNAFPTGPDNRVVLAQVTVPTGSLEYWLNISIFDEGIGRNQLIYVHSWQDPPGNVGEWSELDGNNMGLVFPR